MREWKGLNLDSFKDEQRHAVEAVDVQLHEVSAAIKKLARSLVPEAGVTPLGVSGGGSEVDTTPTPRWLNVLDYSTFQAAINAASNGDIIYVPRGTYDGNTTPTVVPMTVTGKRVGFIGDGLNTMIVNPSASTDLLTISGTDANGCFMEKLRLVGANSAGTGRGLVLSGLQSVYIRDAMMENFPSWAMATPSGSNDVINIIADNVQFRTSIADGLVKLDSSITTTTAFKNCSFITGSGGGRGALITNGHLIDFDGCTFHNGRDTTSTDGDTDSMIVLDATAGGVGGALTTLVVRNSWFESSDTSNNPPNNWFIFLRAGNTNTIIENCYANRSLGSVSSLRFLKSMNGASPGMDSMDLHIRNCDGALTAAQTGTDDIVLGARDTACIEGCSLRDPTLYVRPWRVSGGTVAGLARVNSNYRMKLRGLTTAERDALTDKLAGDMVYNTTTSRVETWDGAAWQKGIRQSLGTAAGDMIYYTGSDAPARLAIGAARQVLMSVGGVPSWQVPDIDMVGHFLTMGG